jgi:hypothetical protein
MLTQSGDTNITELTGTLFALMRPCTTITAKNKFLTPLTQAPAEAMITTVFASLTLSQVYHFGWPAYCRHLALSRENALLSALPSTRIPSRERSASFQAKTVG